jgi:hypothetical protein
MVGRAVVAAHPAHLAGHTCTRAGGPEGFAGSWGATSCSSWKPAAKATSVVAGRWVSECLAERVTGCVRNSFVSNPLGS